MRFSRTFRWGFRVLVLVLVASWFLWLRPQSLGGRNAFIIVSGESMVPTLHPGDLVLVRRRENYRIDQVVAYRVPDGALKGAKVIHRIVGGTASEGFILRGDNKSGADLWRPRPADIVGAESASFAGLGRLALRLRDPFLLAAVAGALAFWLVLEYPHGRRRSPSASELDASGSLG